MTIYAEKEIHSTTWGKPPAEKPGGRENVELPARGPPAPYLNVLTRSADDRIAAKLSWGLVSIMMVI